MSDRTQRVKETETRKVCLNVIPTSISAHPALLSPNHLSHILTHTKYRCAHHLGLTVWVPWQRFAWFKQSKLNEKGEVQIRYMDKCMHWVSETHSNLMNIAVWPTGEVLTMNSQIDKGKKSVFEEGEENRTKGMEEAAQTSMKRKWQKLGLDKHLWAQRREVVGRFWAYNPDNSDWKKM